LEKQECRNRKVEVVKEDYEMRLHSSFSDESGMNELEEEKQIRGRG